MKQRRVKSTLISLILLMFAVGFVSGTVRVARKGNRLIEAKKELETLKIQEEELKKELEYRKSAEFIEMEARNKLNMVRPGEEVYLKPKILGDDLLGAQDDRDGAEGKDENGGGVLFGGIKAKIGSWFDNMRDFLLLFQGS